MDGNLVRRVSFAAVAIPAALGVVWFGGWLLTALVSIIAVLGTRELYDLAARVSVRPSRTFGLLTCAVLPFVVQATLTDPGTATLVAHFWTGASALWLIILLTLLLRFRGPDERPLAAASITLFGVLYSGALPLFLLDIRAMGGGPKSWAGAWLVFFPLVVTWICDTAAMFGGRAMGGPKLAPTVSPGKTRSGAVAGVIGGLATAPLFNALALQPTGVGLSLADALLFAFVLSIVGQTGDLAESLFKREAGVKDSSDLIPGHGGVLDRLDSLYFVIPTAAVMYHLFGR
ncbi:MAG TPA: phosphatidate cytidylyltransferase [Gemmatimonadales bacterium]|nr:phosphatidate cytidylyltransferase [Gemmatimonadales bacterium]